MKQLEEPGRLIKLLEPFKGKWVTLTIDEKEVLGSGDTIDEALKQAKERSGQMPLLMYVPELFYSSSTSFY